MHTKRCNPKGFTMLEVVIVIAVIAILAGLIAPLAVNTIKQSRLNACWDEIQIIKKTIIGDPNMIEGGSRSSFGFVGDLGDLPGNLTELITRDVSRPVYQEYLLQPGNISTGMYYGWRGPYINEFLDPWGRNYNYLIRNASSTDKTIAYIWSSGPDGQTDTDPSSADARNTDNVRISISQDETFTMISGNTLDTCGAGTACSITINTPVGTNTIYTTTPALTTTDTIPIFNTGYSLFPFIAPAPRLYPIGIRRIVIAKGGINYSFLITLNNGPVTISNFREPGACPN